MFWNNLDCDLQESGGRALSGHLPAGGDNSRSLKILEIQRGIPKRNTFGHGWIRMKNGQEMADWTRFRIARQVSVRVGFRRNADTAVTRAGTYACRIVRECVTVHGRHHQTRQTAGDLHPSHNSRHSGFQHVAVPANSISNARDTTPDDLALTGNFAFLKPMEITAEGRAPHPPARCRRHPMHQ